MAENAENSQDLANPGVTGLTNQTSQDNAAGAEIPEESEQTPQTETQDKAASLDAETMPLDELEAKLSVSSSPEPETAEVEDKSEPAVTEQRPALEQTENKENRGEQRYQQLANEVKDLRAQLAAAQADVSQQVKNETRLPTPPWQTDPGKPPEVSPLKVEPGQSFTAEEYQNQVLQQAEAIAAARIQARELELQQQYADQERLRELDETIGTIKKQYPELDPDSPHYSQELDETIGQLVAAHKADPKAVKALTDKVMALRGASIKQGQAQIGEVLAQQKAQQALRPSSSVPEVKPDYNTIPLDELEAKLGMVSG